MIRKKLRLLARQKGRQRKTRKFFWEQLEERCMLAAIDFDGGGDGSSWHDPLNWSTDTLPGSVDDVTIAGGGDLDLVEVVFDTGTTEIQSLNLFGQLEVTGGQLTTGNAQTFGGLSIAGGQFVVTTMLDLGGDVNVVGADSAFRSQGSSSIADGVDIDVSAGGLFSAPRATTVEAVSLTISDSASVDLADLTSLDRSQILLSDGATFTIPNGVTSYTGPTSNVTNRDTTLFLAEGNGSTLDASSLTAFDATFSGFGQISQNVISRDGGLLGLCRARPWRC